MECMMRRKIAVICGAVLLAGVLLGGCSSVASGTVRTAAAVEVSQETKTAEPAENSDTTQESVDSKTGGEKPHVVLQQNETESSEAETGSRGSLRGPLKGPGSHGGEQDLRERDSGDGKNADRLCGRYPVRLPLRGIMASQFLKRGHGIEGGISADLLSIMRSADIFMVNNEFPYTTGGAPRRERNLRSVRIRSTRPGSLTWERISCPWRTTTPMITAKCP